ncbi:NAD(P)-binding protein [Calocera cornea HHB12733]|uniref:NAD(P)-binding protein n=1 Tax=Calocera cornea HHB12733 TaxID=1353952 RepID=A0A165D0A9_9BASI|nr:NAD(P)-binding protein [Calocera cornea HHB12733]
MPSYVVAGASRGLGLEFVKQLLAKGNLVLALARNPDKSTGLQELKGEKNLHILKADITKPDELRAAVAETGKITGGSLDVLINNAAYMTFENTFNAIDEYESDAALAKSFNDHWDTNVLGVVYTTNAFIPLLAKGQLKKVLNLSTGLADPAANLDLEFDQNVAYSVSKCALEMVNVKYAAKYRKEGWTFLAISPGVVNTAEEARTSSPLPQPDRTTVSHTSTAPDWAIPGLQAMAAKFQKYAPTWTGPITATESVGKMLSVFDKAGPELSGKFVSHHGNREWL